MPDFDESKRPEIAFRRPRRLIRFSNLLVGMAACVLFAGAGCCLISPYLFGIQRSDGDDGAKKVAGEVIHWTLPPAYAGVVGITFDNSAFRFDIARFGQEKGRGSLVIARLMWRAWPAPDDPEMRKKFIEGSIEWVKPELHNIDASEREERAFVVGGLSGKCEISHGEDRGSTTKYRQIVGYFHDKSVDGYLILQGEDEYLTQQEIDDFLNSIK
jgi:hypothetical protein